MRAIGDKVAHPEQAAGRWAAGTQASGAAYATGVRFPRRPNPTGAAPSNVPAAARHFVQGTGIGQSSYLAQYIHYRDVLTRVMLPPRKSKGDPRNLRRTQIVCAALHQEKVRRMKTDERKRHKREKCSLCKVRVKLARA